MEEWEVRDARYTYEDRKEAAEQSLKHHDPMWLSTKKLHTATSIRKPNSMPSEIPQISQIVGTTSFSFENEEIADDFFTRPKHITSPTDTFIMIKVFSPISVNFEWHGA